MTFELYGAKYYLNQFQWFYFRFISSSIGLAYIDIKYCVWRIIDCLGGALGLRQGVVNSNITPFESSKCRERNSQE